MTYFMRSGLPVQFCDFENVNILFGKSRINPVFRSEPSFFPVSVGGSGRCDVCDDTTVKMMKSHALSRLSCGFFFYCTEAVPVLVV
mmetsp:Transcript_26810/g.48702  ORF Transcript_26810/g.48702 Transcript_26810/m.48702 type:complete len:86 (-) Transcript_26810:3108-3365(-)